MSLKNGIINPEGMDDPTSALYPVVFGDFMTYRIRDRSGMTVQRLVERYADDDEVGFIVKKRVGGRPVLDEAFKPLKMSVT